MEEDIEEGEIIDDLQDTPVARVRSYEGARQTWPAPAPQFISQPRLPIYSHVGYDSDRPRIKRVVDYGHGNHPSFHMRSNRLQNRSFQRFSKPSYEVKSATSRQNLLTMPRIFITLGKLFVYHILRM